MTIVVLDTNVLVSALLVPASAPAEALRRFRDGEWGLAVSGAILEEYGRVLRRRRFGLSLDLIEALLSEIERRSLRVIPRRHFAVIKEDPADNEFLDVALEAGADAIISGDHHLLRLNVFHGIRILSPAQSLRDL